MDTILKTDFILKWLTDSLVVASALSVLVALGLQIFTRLLLKREDTTTIGIETAPHIETTNWEVDTRLSEARRELERQEEIVRWNRWTINLLTCGQYIIGGVLALTFIEILLSPWKLGFLGILLIGSCLTHQRFRPDIKLLSTCKRGVWLRGLIRRAEDMIFEMKRRKDVEGVHAVRQMISKGLTEMEQSELGEVTGGAETGDA
jgi:hypothetical protein